MPTSVPFLLLVTSFWITFASPVAPAALLRQSSQITSRALGTSANATWHSINFRLPNATSQAFTALSGVIFAPPTATPRAPGGSYYLWPGLQPRDGQGVLQNVLDGADPAAWRLGSGWCCHDPELPWGRSVWPRPGQGVRFANQLKGDGWELAIQLVGGNMSSAVGSFAIANHTMVDTIFAIELYAAEWDFGPLVFQNITMIAEGSSDASWCTSDPENYNNVTDYSISGVRPSTSADRMSATCRIDRLTLLGPRNTDGSTPAGATYSAALPSRTGAPTASDTPTSDAASWRGDIPSAAYVVAVAVSSLPAVLSCCIRKTTFKPMGKQERDPCVQSSLDTP